MIILSIGTNIGDRERNIENAIMALGEIGKVTAISPIYTSEPWGFESENGFYNIALTMESELLPLDLLQETQRIEKELGRTAKTTTEYADRVIDIDIIDYDGQIITISQQSTVNSHQSSIEPPRPTDTPPKTEGEYLDQQSTLNFIAKGSKTFGSQLSALNNSSPVSGEVHEVGRGKTLNSKLSILNSQLSILTLPHPLMHLRNFVLYPLADIAPEWVHPILKLTTLELKAKSADKSIPYKNEAVSK